MTIPNSKIIVLPQRPYERWTRWGVTLAQAIGSGAPGGAANRLAAHSRKPSDRGYRLPSLVAAANRVALRYQIRQLAQSIRAQATSAKWSQRETEKQTGLSYRTINRLAQGNGKHGTWLPRLRSAVARINGQTGPAN